MALWFSSSSTAQFSELRFACALLQEARRLAEESCVIAQGKADWQQSFHKELTAIVDQMVVYDKERQVVYFQAVAQHCSSLPQGKVLVKAAKFEPLQLHHELA